MQKLASTLAEGQHPVVIVDSPMLASSRVHAFWTTAKVRHCPCSITFRIQASAVRTALGMTIVWMCTYTHLLRQ